MADRDVGRPDLAARLEHLFRTVAPPGGLGRWPNEQAAAELARRGSATSAAYLSQLRNRKRDNPSARHPAAISELFGVPLDHFFDSGMAERIDEDVELLSALRDQGVRTAPPARYTDQVDSTRTCTVPRG